MDIQLKQSDSWVHEPRSLKNSLKRKEKGLCRLKLKVFAVPMNTPDYLTSDLENLDSISSSLTTSTTGEVMSMEDGIAGEIELKVTKEAWARALTRAPSNCTLKKEKEAWLRELAMGPIIEKLNLSFGAAQKVIVGLLDEEGDLYDSERMQWITAADSAASNLRAFEDPRWTPIEHEIFDNEEIRESHSRICWEQTMALCDGIFGSQHCLMRWRCRGYDKAFGRLDWEPTDFKLDQILDNLLEIKVKLKGTKQDPDLAIWGCFTRLMSIHWQSECSLKTGSLDLQAFSDQLENIWTSCFEKLGAPQIKISWSCLQMAQYSAQIEVPVLAHPWSQKRLWESLKEVWRATEESLGRGCSLSHPPSPEMVHLGIEEIWSFEQELRSLEQQVKEGLSHRVGGTMALNHEAFA